MINLKKLNKVLPVAVCILAVAVLYILIGCPIKYFTGLSCPGCGMTRAYFSLLKLDVNRAFYYHPLFFLAPFLVFLLFNKGTSLRYKKIKNFSLLVIISAFVVVYFIRLLSGDEIVNFGYPKFLEDFRYIKSLLEGTI